MPFDNQNKSREAIKKSREARFVHSTKELKEDFFGEAPAPFIGRFGYPDINVGILSSQFYTKGKIPFDSPKYWASKNYKIRDVLNLRSELIHSRFNANVKAISPLKEKLVDITKEVGIAKQSAEVEINLMQKPIQKINFLPMAAPTGPKALLKSADITSNTKIDSKVLRAVDDTDLKAADAINELYKKKIDENLLSKALSTGNFGLKDNRKLVPTRWSITATDDTIGKRLSKEVQDYNEINPTAYLGEYLGNYFFVLCFPGIFRYELFEVMAGDLSGPVKTNYEFTTDSENFSGRKGYANDTAGGYYAPRLAILEHLKAIKRQGSILVFRFITDDYTDPLGVWVTKEATRKALQNKPIEFGDNDLLLKYAKIICQKKFKFDIDSMLKKSNIIKEIKEQKTIKNYF